MKFLVTIVAVVACVAASLSVLTAHAGSSDDEFRGGLSAFNTGDYATALRLWRPLAEREEPLSVLKERHRKWKEQVGTAAALAKAGVLFAFATEHLFDDDLRIGQSARGV